VRVSTNEQDTEGQETELRAFVESRGWTYEVYRDKGQSGAKSVRPELTRLLGDLRKRKLDIVVVWALDRLARSLRQLLEIAEQCQSPGVDLISLRQNIDTIVFGKVFRSDSQPRLQEVGEVRFLLARRSAVKIAD
jgi:site-specific DNA recombinase